MSKFKETLGRCIVCGRTFIKTHPKQLTCSEECKLKRMKRIYGGISAKLYTYEQNMRNMWRGRPEEFLLLRLYQSLIRIKILKSLLKEKFDIDVDPNELLRSL